MLRFNMLPPEMLEAIFSNISSAEDKLSLIRAFPVAGPLMRWDVGTLYFELLYPLIHPYIDHDWHHPFILCKVSPAFKDVVLGHFYNLTSAPQQSKGMFDRRWERHIRDLSYHDNLREAIEEVELSESSQWPWIDGMPFLFGCAYEGSLTKYRDERQSVQGFLQKYGPRFLSCYTFFDEFLGHDDQVDHPVENAHLLMVNEILEQMPNLVYLGGCHWHTFFWWNNIHELLAGIPMPEDVWRFPNVRSLKYLEIGLPLSLPNSGVISLPQLEDLRLENFPITFGEYFTTLFWTSPLKYVSVTLDGIGNQFPGLMILLSHFSGTLEQLSINCETRNVPEPLDNSWIFMLKLEKLHYLRIRDYKLSLGFLLALPALMTLRLHYCQSNTGDHSADMFKFPWSQNQKYDTHVWKYLTSLTNLEIWADHPNRQHGDEDERFWLTRSDYENRYK